MEALIHINVLAVTDGAYNKFHRELEAWLKQYTLTSNADVDSDYKVDASIADSEIVS